MSLVQNRSPIFVGKGMPHPPVRVGAVEKFLSRVMKSQTFFRKESVTTSDGMIKKKKRRKGRLEWLELESGFIICNDSVLFYGAVVYISSFLLMSLVYHHQQNHSHHDPQDDHLHHEPHQDSFSSTSLTRFSSSTLSFPDRVLFNTISTKIILLMPY